jgi:hypothetical protein
VSNVYVAEMGQTERAKTLRQQIIKELSASKRVRIANAPEEADAVLSVKVKRGSKNVDEPHQTFGDPTLRTGSKVILTEEFVFRLNTSENRDLWTVKFDAASFYGKDETQRARVLANKLLREFQKAFERDIKRR